MFVTKHNGGRNLYATAATIGNDVRSLVPFWENVCVSWKPRHPAGCGRVRPAQAAADCVEKRTGARCAGTDCR